jgi:photosystem II stability/assembly factor-like uncharacterized protein
MNRHRMAHGRRNPARRKDMRILKGFMLALLVGAVATSIHSSGQDRRPDISGVWRSSIGQVYVIEVQGSRFSWHVEATGQTATGTIDGNRLAASWEAGRKRQSATGKIVDVGRNGRALRIEWSNKVVFFRGEEGEPREGGERRTPPVGEQGRDEPSREGQETRPGGFPDVSGEWFSNRGHQLSIHQTGPEFRIVYLGSGAASLGRFEGEPPGYVLTTVFEGQAIEGRITEGEPQGQALLIQWSNGMKFGREPFAGEPRRGGDEPEREGREDRPREGPPAAQPGVPDISGTWDSSVKRTYEIVQNGNQFSWTVKGTNEKASGVIEGDMIVAEWSGGVGRGRAEGHFAGIDETNRAVEIEWSNGVVFTRPAGSVRQAPAGGQPFVKAKIAAQPVDIVPVEISSEALKRLMPHLSLKSVFNEWVKVGGPIGGLGYDVRFYANGPRGKKVMFVTDNYSGVNKSVDGGENWFASNTGIVSRAGESQDAIPVFSLTVDPNDPHIVWAGLKDKKGLYKSADAGETWTDLTDNLHIQESQFVFRGFTIMPGDSDTVFAQGEIPTSENGLAFNKVRGRIYLTRDGGTTWSVVREEKDLVRYVLINPHDHNIVYASCGIFDREASNSNCKSLASIPNLQQSWEARGGVGVLKSTDGGKSWKVLNRANGLNDLYVGSLVMHPGNPDVLLAGCGNNAASPYRVDGKPHFTGGVFRTENGGEKWVQTLQDDVITSVEFAPSNPNIAYAGGRQRFYASTDSGRSWKLVSGGQVGWGPTGIIAGFPIDILVDPDNPLVLFANNYGGGNVKSTDGGKTWTLASQGYTGALMLDIVIHPANSDIVYAGARNGLFRTMNGGAAWEGLCFAPAKFPECYAVAIHPKNPQIVVASQELLGTVYYSKNGGKSWQEAVKLPAVPGSPVETYGFKRIIFAHSDPQTVYAATCRGTNELKDHPTAFGVYKSGRGGAPGSWAGTNDATMKSRAVNDLAVHPKNHMIVYAATAQGGLFKSTNAGNNWTTIPALAKYDIRSVAVDPVDPRTVYAGLQKGGVYRSSDDGKTWHPMMEGMDSNQSVWAIVVDPTDRKPWAGTRESGVFRWDSIEQQWAPINKGLSTKCIVDLEISTDGKVIYAATTGEGVFRYEKR